MPKRRDGGHLPTDIRAREEEAKVGTARTGTGGKKKPLPARPARGVMTIPPPTQVKPPNSVDFNRAGFATGLNVATTPFVFPGTVYRLGAGNQGVIRSFVLSVNTLLLTSVIIWRLRADGNPLTGWEDLRVPTGAVAFMTFAWGPDETQIIVPEGAVIDFEIEVQDAGTYAAGALYHGWTLNRSTMDRLQGAYR